jgi:hypothetical protein
LIWVKRLLPIILIVGVVFGYRYWDRHRTAQAEARTEHMALVTARVWVGSAEYYSEPQAFLSWRDSVLAVEGVSKEAIRRYMERYEDKPEQYLQFTKLVDYFVDSIVAVSEGIEPPSRDSAMSMQIE